MSLAQRLPTYLRLRREKVFGEGRPRALDRNAKVRIMTLARALSHRTQKGKHYGVISAKTLVVLEALLWGFHNARSGLCFPSYETIAARAKCARSTVGEAIKTLEEAGILSWVNRIARIRDRVPDLFGKWAFRERIIRTSNAYQFRDPQPGHGQNVVSLGNSSKSEIPSGLNNQEYYSSTPEPKAKVLDQNSPLELALFRLGKTIRAL